MTSAGDPAIVIDASITKHFEILSGVRLAGLRIVEGVNHRGPVKRPLRCTVHALRERQSSGLQYGRSNIRDVSKLRADFSPRLNPRWPMYNYAVRGPSVVRCNLFCPLEWSVASPRPANRIMRK